MIIGIVVGGAAFIFAVACFAWYRRKLMASVQPLDGNASTGANLIDHNLKVPSVQPLDGKSSTGPNLSDHNRKVHPASAVTAIPSPAAGELEPREPGAVVKRKYTDQL